VNSHNNTPRAVRLDWKATISDVIAAWPGQLPIAALVSAATHERWSRWSIFGVSSGIVTELAELNAALDRTPNKNDHLLDPDEPPFASGLIGWINYDAGFEFEPTARQVRGSSPIGDRGWPMACLHRCEAAYVHDRLSNQWWAVGDASALPEIDLSQGAVAPNSMTGETPVPLGSSMTGEMLDPLVAPIHGSLSRAEYESAVARVIDYIRAGDIFQANISRRLTTEFSGSVRALAIQLFDAIGPWYGALIEGPTPGRAVLSMSPELFVEVQPSTRKITTRPIKGTAPAAASPSELARSEKDRAELVMIVDLMRNDLGRLCEFGSIRVVDAQTIEQHGGVGSRAELGVLHGVATVVGDLRDDASAMDILRATFPAGSITGAPKIRAMQIIEEIEPVRRGPYCGAVGWFDDRGGMALNVAIRTASIVGEPTNGRWDEAIGDVDYSVGAGIVADSVPDKEWAETEAKAAGFVSALQSLRVSKPTSEALA